MVAWLAEQLCHVRHAAGGAGEGVVHHLNQQFAIQQLSGMVVAAGMAGQLKMVMIGHLASGWHWWWVDWC